MHISDCWFNVRKISKPNKQIKKKRFNAATNENKAYTRFVTLL